MSKKNAYLIICCLSIHVQMASAQVYSSKELRQFDKRFFKAEEAFYNEDFKTALKDYELIIESGLNYGSRLFYCAELCSLLTKYQNKPLDKFLSYEEEMSRKDKFYFYWKGRVLLRKYKMREAIQSFRQFLAKNKYASGEIKEEIKNLMKWANNMAEIMEVPDKIVLNQLKSQNTASAEVSPVYFEDHNEMLFLSNKGTKEGRFKVYRCGTTPEGRWAEPEPVERLGTFSAKNAYIQLNSSQNLLYFFKEDKKSTGIYFSRYKAASKSWSAPALLDKNIKTITSGSRFYINKEENRIIFSQDLGNHKEPNLDLLEITKQSSGKWSKPKSIGASVNSEANEDAPYLSSDGQTLYFTSDGHDTMGGYDVFKSTFDSRAMTWSEPVNMGFPINSPDDEIQFKINDDQSGGQFTANRLNTKDYDLFFFWESEKLRMKGRILDPALETPVAGIKIRFEVAEDPNKVFTTDVNDKGAYIIDIDIDAKVTYMVSVLDQEESTIVDTVETGFDYAIDKVMNRDFYYKKEVKVNAAAITQNEDLRVTDMYQDHDAETLDRLSSKFRRSNRAILSNIYFDVGAYELKGQSNEILRSIKKLMDEKKLVVEIAGHADNTEVLNEDLSFNRAFAVKTWLVENGIDPGRLIARGYGDASPLASNDDELDGRELNRRIEIIVHE